jgi:electron transfer flavoprotein alpha subunit
MAARIWVLCEQRDGRPLSSVLELVSAASRFGASVDGFSWGAGAAQAASILGAYGLSRLFDLGDLGDALAGPRVAAVLAEEIEVAEERPDALLVAMTYDGRDVAGRLSARLDLPLLANVVGLSETEEGFVSEHEIAGGSKIARARFTGPGPGIFLVRPKSFVAEERVQAQAAAVVARPASEQGPADAARVVGRHVNERTGPSLDDANVVVSGGRGLGQRENYERVEQLARLLNGAPAATRAIVDAGWVPYAYQVGQTGKTVKPEVYLACGISGATQHLIGMKGAKHVIAINKDESAPIFSVADLGIVGDVNVVLPRLIEAVQARL